jgi:hypothetical protein
MLTWERQTFLLNEKQTLNMYELISIEAQAVNFMHKLHFVIDVMRRSSGFKCNIFKSRCILINTFDFACFLLIDVKNTPNYKFVKVPNSTYR